MVGQIGFPAKLSDPQIKFAFFLMGGGDPSEFDAACCPEDPRSTLVPILARCRIQLQKCGQIRPFEPVFRPFGPTYLGTG